MEESDHSNVCLAQSTVPGSGQGLVATKDFNPGECVFSFKRTLVEALDRDRLEDTCANCFWQTVQKSGALGDQISEDNDALRHSPKTQEKKLSLCTGCRHVRYCSKVHGDSIDAEKGFAHAHVFRAYLHSLFLLPILVS